MKKRYYITLFVAWIGIIVTALRVKGYQMPRRKSYTSEEMVRIAIERTMQNILAGYPVIEVPEEKDGWGALQILCHDVRKPRFFEVMSKFGALGILPP